MIGGGGPDRRKNLENKMFFDYKSFQRTWMNYNNITKEEYYTTFSEANKSIKEKGLSTVEIFRRINLYFINKYDRRKE